MEKSDKKPKMSKTVAIIFALLMVGSTFGMFVEIFLKKDNVIEIPSSRVINYRLNEVQSKELLKNYYTLIEYEYPSGCLECSNLLTSLEGWTTSSDNQIYLQEIELSSSSSSKVTITSLRGQEILYEPSTTEVRDIICEIIINRPLLCIEI